MPRKRANSASDSQSNPSAMLVMDETVARWI
jgi:hypothetical protein